jgi:hypothetical protein
MRLVLADAMRLLVEKDGSPFPVESRPPHEYQAFILRLRVLYQGSRV